jgi:hypothetical protein
MKEIWKRNTAKIICDNVRVSVIIWYRNVYGKKGEIQ